MANEKFLEHNDFKKYIDFFNLKMNFTVEELEIARYQKQLENKEDKTIEQKYQKLMCVALQGLNNNIENIFENNVMSEKYFEKYKSELLASYQQKYEAKKPYTKQNEALNLELDSVNETVKAHKDQLINSNANDIRNILDDFYNSYTIGCKSFITDYYDITKEKSNNKGATILEYVKNHGINNILNDTLYNLVDIELPRKLLNNQNSLVKMINDLFYKISNEYKRTETESVLEVFYEKIDSFLESLYSDILKDINSSIYQNDTDIENKYNEIVEKINPRINIFNAGIQDSIKIALKSKIMEQKNFAVPQQDLFTKLKLATTFENYAEVFNIVYNINNKNQEKQEEKEIQVIPVTR